MAYSERLWSELEDAPPAGFEHRRAFLLDALEPPARVLDLGCGSGWFSDVLVRAGFAVTGEDVAERALELARARAPGATFVLGGETSLPLPGACVDAVWLGEVLEHVQDGIGLLEEVARVLVPGGRLVATTPDHWWLLRLRVGVRARAFERHFDPRSDHVRFFTARSLRELLAVSGFAEVSVRARRGSLEATARAVG